MADMKESEERYLARIVDDVHELDLGVVRLAALLSGDSYRGRCCHCQRCGRGIFGQCGGVWLQQE